MIYVKFLKEIQLVEKTPKNFTALFFKFWHNSNKNSLSAERKLLCLKVIYIFCLRLAEQVSHYHFVDVAEFELLIEQGAFLEYAKVFGGNYYGTSLPAIEKNLAAGIDVFLDIDWQGAQQIREKVPSVKSIFILPPSLAELEQRLIGRGQDSAEVIAERMSKAMDEISHYNEYDYVIVNDDFEQALADLQSILRAEKLTLAYQESQNRTLIQELLAK